MARPDNCSKLFAAINSKTSEICKLKSCPPMPSANESLDKQIASDFSLTDKPKKSLFQISPTDHLQYSQQLE